MRESLMVIKISFYSRRNLMHSRMFKMKDNGKKTASTIATSLQWFSLLTFSFTEITIKDKNKYSLCLRTKRSVSDTLFYLTFEIQ